MSKSKLEIEVNICSCCIRKVSAPTGALQKNAADSTNRIPSTSQPWKRRMVEHLHGCGVLYRTYSVLLSGHLG